MTSRIDQPLLTRFVEDELDDRQWTILARQIAHALVDYMSSDASDCRSRSDVELLEYAQDTFGRIELYQALTSEPGLPTLVGLTRLASFFVTSLDLDDLVLDPASSALVLDMGLDDDSPGVNLAAAGPLALAAGDLELAAHAASVTLEFLATPSIAETLDLDPELLRAAATSTWAALEPAELQLSAIRARY